MSKKSRQSEVLTYIPHRAGEGTLVDVAVKEIVGTTGRSISQMGINLARAPVPDRKYAADTCSVSYANQTIRISFGQQRLNNDGKLRSLVVVLLSPPSIAEFIKSTHSVVNPSFAEIAERVGFVAEELPKLREEPDQSIALAANMILVAMSGFDSCLDFYQASPFAIRTAAHTHKLAVEAVVRIDLRSGLLLGLLDEMDIIQKEFPKSVTNGSIS